MDHITLLPDELLCSLLCYLNCNELCRVRSVSKRFNSLVVAELRLRCHEIIAKLLHTIPNNSVQLILLEFCRKRLAHVQHFYFAGALLDNAIQLLSSELAVLEEDTDIFHIYNIVKPFELLYFRAEVSRIVHITEE